MTEREFDFDVALSFAGEDREYVEEVAQILRSMGFRVFYDKHDSTTLWGRDLYSHLSEIYFQRAAYVVIFISKHYKAKLWTNVERESAQARAMAEKREYILPARFDDSEIPGILPTTGYVNLSEHSPEQLAQLVKRKIGPMKRREFFPLCPDRLYESLGVTQRDEAQWVLETAHHLFENMKLMTF